MRHHSEIRLNNSASLLFSMFYSHDKVFEKYQKKLLHCNYLMFFLFVEIVNQKKNYQAHVMNLLLFFILESVSMLIVLICCKNMAIIFSKSVGDFFFCSNSFILHWKKIFQEILYTTTLDYFFAIHKVEEGSEIGSWRDCCVFS